MLLIPLEVGAPGHRLSFGRLPGHWTRICATYDHVFPGLRHVRRPSGALGRLRRGRVRRQPGASAEPPTPGKLTTYESGMDPVGTTWSQTQIRYYVFAFLFVIFDVESVFLFPWALVFDNIGVAAFWEMVVFIGVLAIGLLYAFKKGVLRWA